MIVQSIPQASAVVIVPITPYIGSIQSSKKALLSNNIISSSSDFADLYTAYNFLCLQKKALNEASVAEVFNWGTAVYESVWATLQLVKDRFLSTFFFGATSLGEVLTSFAFLGSSMGSSQNASQKAEQIKEIMLLVQRGEELTDTQKALAQQAINAVKNNNLESLVKTNTNNFVKNFVAFVQLLVGLGLSLGTLAKLTGKDKSILGHLKENSFTKALDKGKEKIFRPFGKYSEAVESLSMALPMVGMTFWRGSLISKLADPTLRMTEAALQVANKSCAIESFLKVGQATFLKNNNSIFAKIIEGFISSWMAINYLLSAKDTFVGAQSEAS